MALEVSLDRVQRWMQSVVVHPGAVTEAVESPEAQAEVARARIGDVILPSRSLTPVERVGIYHGMYLLRMLEALESDYPALKHFLGDHAFRELVRDYVQAHPSRSFSLNRLGDHLPEYIRTLRGLRRRDFCYDLARLELGISQVFDAPETPALTADQIAAVRPDAWERARLTPVAAFRLLGFRYPVNAYLQTVRDENHDHPKIRLKDSQIALYRREYTVYRHELSRPAHDLLSDLVHGMPLGGAVGSALKREGRRAPREEELFRWFREWVSGGVFQAVTID